LFNLAGSLGYRCAFVHMLSYQPTRVFTGLYAGGYCEITTASSHRRLLWSPALPFFPLRVPLHESSSRTVVRAQTCAVHTFGVFDAILDIEPSDQLRRLLALFAAQSLRRSDLRGCPFTSSFATFPVHANQALASTKLHHASSRSQPVLGLTSSTACARSFQEPFPIRELAAESRRAVRRGRRARQV
jgi:hypothetical protein